MLDVFVFSNSFAAKNIIFSIDYLFNDAVSTVFVLGENHNSKDFFSSNVEVIIHDDIDLCITNSNLILMLLDNDIPIRVIKYIESIAKKQEKKLIKLNNPWKNKVPETKNFNHPNFIRFPTILLFTVGFAAQGYCTEIILNELFSNKKIEICQLFSEETEYLMRQINDYKLLNENLRKHIQKNCNDFKVVVSTSNIAGANVADLTKKLEIARKMSPDFVILQTDYESDYNKLKNIIEFNLFSNTDLVLKSNYINYDSNCVYCTGENELDVLYIENRNIKDILEKRIFFFFFFPEGCRVL